MHVYVLESPCRERCDETSFEVADTSELSSAAGDVSRVRVDVTGVVAEREPGSGVPLYFAQDADRLAISTDLATLETLGVPRVADEQAVHTHLAFGLLTGGRTYLAGVGQVQAGEQVRWNLAAGRGPRRRLTAIAVDVPICPTDIDDLLADVLTSWRASPHVLLLSGGLDSSLLYRLLYRASSPRPTFSTDYWFYRTTAPERRYAETAAAELGADHVFVRSDRAQYLRHLVTATAATHVPLGGLQAALIHGLLAAVPTVGPTTFITGQGADALFGGPSPGTDWRSAETRFGPWRHAWESVCAALGITGDPFADRVDVLSTIDATDHTEPNRWRLFQLLTYTDRGQTSWVGSARSLGHAMVYPFLDRRVIAWAAGNVAERNWAPTKPALQAAAVRVGLSDQLIHRPKLSFGPTGTEWLTEFSGLHWLVADLMDRRSFERIVALPDSRFVVWNLLTYAVWHRMVLKRESVDDILDRMAALPPG